MNDRWNVRVVKVKHVSSHGVECGRRQHVESLPAPDHRGLLTNRKTSVNLGGTLNRWVKTS